MLWALHADTRRMVHISYFERAQTGLGCNCICYSCSTSLEAVNAGRDANYFLQPSARGQFFRHSRGNQKDDCLKTAARLAAIHMFMQLEQIDLPAPKVRRTVVGLSGEVYEHTEIGQRVRGHIASRRWIDEQKAQVTLDNGRVILLTLVTGTSATSDGHFDAVITIQVDDPDVASWSPEKLLQNAVLVDEWVCWDQHWEHEALAEKAEIQALQQAQEWMDSEPDIDGLPPELNYLQKSETVLHGVLKAMLIDIGHIRAPGYSARVERTMPNGHVRVLSPTLHPMTLALQDVRLEFRLGDKIPDVMCRAEDQSGQLGTFDLMIEVAVTHRVDAAKKAKIERSAVACLEIDVDLLNLRRRCSKFELRAALTQDANNKRWIFLPAMQKRIEVANRQLQEQSMLMEKSIAAMAERNRWAENLTVDELATLYLAALRKQWVSPQFDLSRVSVQHGRYSLGLDELVRLMHDKGCPHADAPPLFERYGILWCLYTIERASHWPDIPFSLHGVLLRAHNSDACRPYVGLMAIAAHVYEIRDMQAMQPVQEMLRTVRESLRKGEFEYARPDTYDAVIKAVFPPLIERMEQPGGTRNQAVNIQRKIQIEREQKLNEDRIRLQELSAAQERKAAEADQRDQLEKTLKKVTKDGWLPPNGLSRSIEQCKGYIKAKRIAQIGTDPEMLVASAHRARGMGVDLEQWLRDQNPSTAQDADRIARLLKTAWLLN